jgi:hypothetical protein
VDVDFQTLAYHAQGIADVVLRVEQKFLRKDVQHHAVLRQSDVARGIHGAPNVLAFDIPGAVSQRDPAAAVHTANMTPGDSGNRALHRNPADPFGFFHGPPDRSRRRAQIRDEPLPQPSGLRRSHRNEPHRRFIRFAHYGARFRAADVQRYQVLIFLGQSAAPSPPLAGLDVAAAEPSQTNPCRVTAASAPAPLQPGRLRWCPPPRRCFRG